MQVYETVHAHYDSVSMYSEEKCRSGLLQAHLLQGHPPVGASFPLSLHWLGWLGGPL